MVHQIYSGKICSLQKVQNHKYQNRQMFSDDVELIYMNSAQYNGAQSAFTATAFKMLQVCKVALQEVWYPELQKFEKFWNENLIN